MKCTWMSTSGAILTGVILLALALVAPSFAGPPATVNIRGQLLDAQGHGLPGLRAFSVQFYDASTAGNALGAAILGQVEVTPEGLFNVAVTLPAEVLASLEAWYEVAVASGTPPGALAAGDVFPSRVKVESVPFALESQEATHVDVSGIGSGTVLDAEFDALSGVTDGIQDQLDAKADSADVYTKGEVGSSQSAQDLVIASKANTADVYTKGQVDSSQSAQDTVIAAKANAADVYTKGEVDTSQSAQDAVIAVKANAADVYTMGEVDSSQSAQNAVIADKANAADVYTKGEVDSSQSAQDAIIADKANAADVYTQQEVDDALVLKANASDLAGKVAKAGDTMTGTLEMSGAPVNVTGSYVGIGQATAPATPADKLYNVGGTLEWNGHPAYRFPWTTVTADTQMAGNNGYIANGASLLTLTLPLSANVNVGDMIRVSGTGAGGWKIAQNASQTILTGAMQIPDYSGTWTSQASGNWLDMDASADGNTLVACAWDGHLYTSDDAGATWTARTGAGGGRWIGVASSADGVKLAACDQSPGFIWTSADGGVTWTSHAMSRAWNRLASSADGTKLVACVSDGPIYTSTNSGVTWTSRATVQPWQDVDSSADGATLAACTGSSGNVWVSTDSGVNWTLCAGSPPANAVAVSADGSKLLASVNNDRLYTSTDGGLTWTARAGAQSWFAATMSADGSVLAACGSVGPVAVLNTKGATDVRTTVGTDGCIAGAADSAVALEYVSTNTFCVVSHEKPESYQAVTKPELDVVAAGLDTVPPTAIVMSETKSNANLGGYTCIGSVVLNATAPGAVPDTWTATATSSAPTARYWHTAVWTGSQMIVWGGVNDGSFYNTGGRYDPAADAWSATTTTGAPTARTYHTAVWTGSQMIIWGGYNASTTSYLNTGGRYDPAADSWSATTTTGAPAGRRDPTAVCTGSEMVVWGGYDGSSYLNTGGRYDLALDAWNVTTTINAPTARTYHTAVWTGSQMIVWGGYNWSYLNTGGRYNPVTNNWTATSTGSAPTGRELPTAVWTGSEVIVWGGDNGGYLNTGGRYDPATDSWGATTTAGAPTARNYHKAVWTGSEMIVWGGHNGSYLNTGGVLSPQTSPIPMHLFRKN